MGLFLEPEWSPQTLVKTHLRRLRQEKVSGGVVFFDGVAAFYSAIREFICDGSVNADYNSGLLELLGMLCPDESPQQQLLAVLCGLPFLKRLRPHLFFVVSLRRLCRELVLLWSRNLMAYGLRARALACKACLPTRYVKLSCLSTRVDCKLQCPPRDTRLAEHHAPAATWLDDLAVLLLALVASELIGQVRTLIQHVELAVRRVGICTNFSPRKAEATIALYGEGSQILRRKWLSADNPTLPVELQSGEKVSVSLTDRYVHLGSVVHYSRLDFLDVQRMLLAQMAYEPVRKRLLRNPFLSAADKLRGVAYDYPQVHVWGWGVGFVN